MMRSVLMVQLARRMILLRRKQLVMKHSASVKPAVDSCKGVAGPYPDACQSSNLGPLCGPSPASQLSNNT